MMIPIYNILQYNLLSVGFSVAPRRPEASLGSRTPRQQNSGDAPRVSSERRGRHTFGRRPMVRNRLSIQDLKKNTVELFNMEVSQNGDTPKSSMLI